MLKRVQVYKLKRRSLWSVIFLFAFSVIFLAFSRDDCPIEWRADRPLKREDFKGKRIHKDAVASTTYNITKELTERNGRVKANVTAFFYCYNSWILKDTAGNDVILHEQKHFDIAELYARKLRKEMLSLTFKNLKEAEKKSDSLLKLTNQQMDVFQDNYDNETDHSRNGAQQRKWNWKIAVRLHELENFSESEFYLSQNSLSQK